MMPDQAPDPAIMATIHAAAFSAQRPWSAQEFEDLSQSPLCIAIGDARAFALIRVVADEVELLTIATHPDQQRRGLARARMADWEQAAAARGAVRAFLEVAQDNAPARALYEAAGYRECGRRTGYYPRKDGHLVDAIIMEKTLTQG